MTRRNLLRFLLPAPFAVAALVITVTSLLPYRVLRSGADAVVSDGNFMSLNETNVLVFRILLGSAAVVLLGSAAMVATGRSRAVKTSFRRLLIDSLDFARTLKPPRTEAVYMMALFLVMVVAVIYRLPHLNENMSHDESYTYIAFGSTSLFNIVTNYQLPNNHILNSILIYFATRLLGIEPWAIRLPALLAGLLIIAGCYALAKAIYDRHTALIAALLVAILPGAIANSTVGRGYNLVALFTLLALWLADYVCHRKNLLAWSLLVLCCALGFYSVPVMLFPFGIVFAWMFFEILVTEPGPYGSRANFLKYWLVAGLATAGLVLILYTPIFIYTGSDKVFANQWVLPRAWSRFISSVPGAVIAVWRRWTGGMPSIISLVLIAGSFLSALFHRRLAQQRFPLQAATFIWLSAILLLRRPQGATKIWAFLEAPFMIWAAAGTVGLLKDLRPKLFRGTSLGTIIVGVALASALAGAALIIPTLSDRWSAKGPVEKVVLAIKSQLGAHDLILVDGAYGPAVWYYARLHGIPQEHFDRRLPFDHLFVVDAHSQGESLDTIIATQCSRSCPIDPDSKQLIANFQDLDVLRLSSR